MIFADMSIALEPAYPWSIPTIGPVAMLGVALALTALTVWTYLGVQQATWRRVVIVLGLRLAALACAFAILLRPSFAMTQLEGVEASKLLIVRDYSKSMDVSEREGKPTRWQEVNDIWTSKSVERKLRRLAEEEKIEVIQYLGARDLKPLEKDAQPDGERTDIGAWLQQLWTKHGHEKRLRGIVLFSDGGDNGTRFSTTEQARRWRGFAPIHAFGVGDPKNAKFKKDLGLTKIDVRPERIFVKTPMTIDVIAQAPGFEKTEFSGSIEIKGVDDKAQPKTHPIPPFRIETEKDHRIKAIIAAPEDAGEYKVTVKITPHPDETNPQNNEIVTYVRVLQESINVLWVDRPRVYEPIQIIRLALAPEERLKVHYLEVRPGAEGDPVKEYKLDKNTYDVIVIGDVAARDFSFGKPEFFEVFKKMVAEKKAGLLMLGGSETFVKGGWKDHAAFMSLLPVDFDLKGKKADFGPDTITPVRATPTPDGLKEPFCQLDPDAKTNANIWGEKFEPLKGVAPVGGVASGSTVFLKGGNGEPVLVATRAGLGRSAVFAGDSTADQWLYNDSAARGFKTFWKRLVYWLANQEDRTNQLVITLDKRRLTTDAADVLGFTAILRNPKGEEMRGATFNAKVMHGDKELPVRVTPQGSGSFQGAKELGEYRLIVEGVAKDVSAKDSVRFLVVPDAVETLRPLADHESLIRIASASEGRFQPASEEALLAYLDEVAKQVERESRVKTTRWPDWNRVPASDSARDQLPGIWNSFALLGMLLFVTVLGCEWLLRRIWGLA